MNPQRNQQGEQTAVPGLGAIVMAAGLGKRMRSKLAKVLHPVAGRPMALYAVELANRLAGAGTVVVVGHQAEQVKAAVAAYCTADAGPARARGGARREQGLTAQVRTPGAAIPPVLFAEQREQLGTGHAVMQARAAFRRARGAPAAAYVILNGDTPLLREATVRALVQLHDTQQAAVTILTAVLEDASGYGRVVRDQAGGRVLRIVEDRDAGAAERAIREINVGTYVVNGSFLFEALDKLQPQNAQKEYYLTDVIGLAVERGLPVAALVAPQAEEALGINSRQQLAAAERVIRQEICARWMDAGVTLQDPATTWIDWEVQIGRDTVIHPQVTLEGKTTIGDDCVLRSHSRIADSELGQRVTVLDGSVVSGACLEDDTTVGPYAHLRPGAVLRRKAKVGNFVEVKKAELGEGSKANHLTYLGDARIGRGVNIGAGTITCNYDGVKKYETVIEDEVFVGSDSQFVAPVTIGRGAVVAAGTTVTLDVPADALAISRVTQVNRAGWAAKRRAWLAGAGGEAPGVTREATSSRKPPAPHSSRLTKKEKAGGRKGKG